MEIYFHERDKTYDFTKVTETEFQIFVKAFLTSTPFSDIEELYMYSRRIWQQLDEANDALIERYRGK